MIDIRMKYQGNIFVQASDIKPDPENTKTLIELFKDKGLIPSTFQEIGPYTIGPNLRTRLSSPDNEWEVLIASERITINKNAKDEKGSNIGEINDFQTEVSDLFGRIQKNYRKRANRIALSSDFLLKEMSKEALSEIYLSLFKPINYYAENDPFEWDWRSVAKQPLKILNFKESLNVITIIKRMQGSFGTQAGIRDFDRIQVAFDVNVEPQNKEYRFELKHVKEFFTKAGILHEKILKEILEFMDES